MVWIFNKIENPGEIWGHVRSAYWPSLVVLVVMSLVPHVIRAWRWRRLIGEPVSLFYSFTSVMIGYAVNDVLPRVGEVTRLVNMNRMTQVPMAKLLSTMVAERLLDMLALVFLLILALAIEGERIGQYFPLIGHTGPIALVLVLVGILGLILIAFSSEWLCTTLGGLADNLSQGLGTKLQTLIRQGAEGLAFLKSPYQALMVTLETALIWVCYWVSYLAGLHAFHLSEVLGFKAMTVTFAITCCSVVPPTIGGVGTYHYFGSQSLIKLYGVARSSAVACVTVEHFLVFYVVGGLFGVLAWTAQCWRHKQ